MATVSPTTTTIGGVTTTTEAKAPTAWERYQLFSPEQIKAYNDYVIRNNLSSSVGGAAGEKIRNKRLDDFLAQYKDPNAPAATTPLSTLLPDDQTTSLLSSGEEKDVLAQKDDVAAMEQYLEAEEVDAEAPTAESTLPQGETKAELTTAPVEEKKKQESLGNVNVPTQNYTLGNTPNNNLPSNVDAAPKVPTKANVNISAKSRRGRASTIGLGRRSANTELSSNIVKLLGV
jgi:hypothetical protein